MSSLLQYFGAIAGSKKEVLSLHTVTLRVS